MRSIRLLKTTKPATSRRRNGHCRTHKFLLFPWTTKRRRMLTLLLDEHMSAVIAKQVAAKDATIRIASIHDWHGGEFLHTDDEVILEAAHREQTTLVMFVQSTIRPVLKEWGEQGRSHGGV